MNISALGGNSWCSANSTACWAWSNRRLRKSLHPYPTGTYMYSRDVRSWNIPAGSVVRSFLCRYLSVLRRRNNIAQRVGWGDGLPCRVTAHGHSQRIASLPDDNPTESVSEAWALVFKNGRKQRGKVIAQSWLPTQGCAEQQLWCHERFGDWTSRASGLKCRDSRSSVQYISRHRRWSPWMCGSAPPRKIPSFPPFSLVWNREGKHPRFRTKSLTSGYLQHSEGCEALKYSRRQGGQAVGIQVPFGAKETRGEEQRRHGSLKVTFCPLSGPWSRHTRAINSQTASTLLQILATKMWVCSEINGAGQNSRSGKRLSIIQGWTACELWQPNPIGELACPRISNTYNAAGGGRNCSSQRQWDPWMGRSAHRESSNIPAFSGSGWDHGQLTGVLGWARRPGIFPPVRWWSRCRPRFFRPRQIMQWGTRQPGFAFVVHHAWSAANHGLARKNTDGGRIPWNICAEARRPHKYRSVSTEPLDCSKSRKRVSRTNLAPLVQRCAVRGARYTNVVRWKSDAWKYRPFDVANRSSTAAVYQTIPNTSSKPWLLAEAGMQICMISSCTTQFGSPGGEHGESTNIRALEPLTSIRGHSEISPPAGWWGHLRAVPFWCRWKVSSGLEQVT